MVGRIKNKHLRRLALLAFVPFALLASPVEAFIDYYPEFTRELVRDVIYLWNKP